MIITNLHKLIARILVGVHTLAHTHTLTDSVLQLKNICVFFKAVAYLYDLLINHCCGICAAIKAAQTRRALR